MWVGKSSQLVTIGNSIVITRMVMGLLPYRMILIMRRKIFKIDMMEISQIQQTNMNSRTDLGSVWLNNKILLTNLINPNHNTLQVRKSSIMIKTMMLNKRMIMDMKKIHLYYLMVLIIRGNLCIILIMVRKSRLLQTSLEKLIEVNNKLQERKSLPMVLFMRVNSKMILKVVKVYSCGLMTLVTKENSKMVKLMARVL